MAHTIEARIEVFKRDHGECQAEYCSGYEYEGERRQFYPTNEIHWNNIVLNGDWQVNASHLKKRTYIGNDPDVYNPNGTPRSEILCVLDHAKYEVSKFCSYRNAMLVLTGQTLKTFRWIQENGEDKDLPLDIGIFSPKEVININNIRREKLKTLFRLQAGLLLPESVYYSIA